MSRSLPAHTHCAVRTLSQLRGHLPPPLSRRRGRNESFTPPTHTLCCPHLVTAPWSSPPRSPGGGEGMSRSLPPHTHCAVRTLFQLRGHPPPLSRGRGGDESFTPHHTLCCPHLVTARWSSRSFCERSLTSWSSRWPHTTSGWLQQRNAAAVVKKQPEAGRRKQQQSPWRHCLWGQNRPLIERLLLLLLRRRRRRSNSGCWPSRGPGAGN